MAHNLKEFRLCVISILLGGTFRVDFPSPCSNRNYSHTKFNKKNTFNLNCHRKMTKITIVIIKKEISESGYRKYHNLRDYYRPFGASSSLYVSPSFLRAMRKSSNSINNK